MDFRPDARQRELRAEIRDVLARPDVRDAVAAARRVKRGEEPDASKIYRRLGEAGLLAVNWPAELGGRDGSLLDAAVVSEELNWHGVPDTVHTVSVDIVGLFLMLAASDEQRRRFLPPIARGELFVSVLYTEPEAGSDLSSLRTKAFRQGDDFLLFGTKIYSLRSRDADYGLCAARTTEGDNPHRGITLFMVPLRGDGIEIRRVPSIAEESFDEVVFDGARVSSRDVIGPVDHGWQLLSGALALERTGLEQATKARGWLDLLMRSGAAEAGEQPSVAEALVELETEVEASRLLAYHVLSRLAAHEIDPGAAAMSKWYASELVRRIATLALDMHGIDGLLSRWDEEGPAEGLAESLYREAPGLTISAGSSEIMLRIVASSVLGNEEEGSRTSV